MYFADLLGVVGRLSDDNGTRAANAYLGLAVSDVQQRFDALQPLLTSAVVEAALTDGLCSAVDFLTPDEDPLFYPSKPIRIIVCTSPGGATDVTTRLVAQKMGEKLGQSVIVENKPGGDTLLGVLYAKDQPADGYTLVAQSLNFTTLPYIKRNPGYSPTKDFIGVGNMSRVPFLMVIGGSEPSKSVAEYVARAKREDLSFGHGANAGAPHIASELFLRSQKIKAMAIPYKGNGAAMADLIAGRVSFMFDAYVSSAGFLSSGRARALAVAHPTRLTVLPDVPTFKELGIDFNYGVWLGLLARTGTPPEAVAKLSEALRYALDSKEVGGRLRSDGSEVSFMTPRDFTDYLAREYVEMGQVATELGFTKE